MRNIILVTTALVATSGAAVANATPTAESGPKNPPRWQTTACVQEDDYDCFWDAKVQGDGNGHSFWAIPLNDGKVAVVYWNAKYNLKHGFVSGR